MRAFVSRSARLHKRTECALVLERHVDGEAGGAQGADRRVEAAERGVDDEDRSAGLEVIGGRGEERIQQRSAVAIGIPRAGWVCLAVEQKCRSSVNGSRGRGAVSARGDCQEVVLLQRAWMVLPCTRSMCWPGRSGRPQRMQRRIWAPGASREPLSAASREAA